MTDLKHGVWRAYCSGHGFWMIQSEDEPRYAPLCLTCERDLKLEREGRSLAPLPWTWVPYATKFTNYKDRAQTLQELQEEAEVILFPNPRGT